MGLTIRRKVSLGFLGEEFEDAYLKFKAISVAEYEDLQEKIQGFEKNPQGSVTFILGLLKEHFIEGKAPNDKGDLEDVVADDLDNLDPGSLVPVFQAFTGQELDPKGEKPLTSVSSMATETQ